MVRTKPATPNGQTQPGAESIEQEEQPVLTEQRQRIGPAIRQLRQQQKLSLSDLAAKTGISVSYLSRLEKGRSVPAFTLLSRIGQVLGMPIEELSHTPILKRVWPEILGLSLEGRKVSA